jgi:hypothetical protein
VVDPFTPHTRRTINPSCEERGVECLQGLAPHQMPVHRLPFLPWDWDGFATKGNRP